MKKLILVLTIVFIVLSYFVFTVYEDFEFRIQENEEKIANLESKVDELEGQVIHLDSQINFGPLGLKSRIEELENY